MQTTQHVVINGRTDSNVDNKHWPYW